MAARRALHGQAAAVEPWIVRRQEKAIADGEYRQTPEQLDAYKQFSMCIKNCLLCCSACPIFGVALVLSAVAACRLLAFR